MTAITWNKARKKMNCTCTAANFKDCADCRMLAFVSQACPCHRYVLAPPAPLRAVLWVK
jgi:hypothetical protein